MKSSKACVVFRVSLIMKSYELIAYTQYFIRTFLLPLGMVAKVWKSHLVCLSSTSFSRLVDEFPLLKT